MSVSNFGKHLVVRASRGLLFRLKDTDGAPTKDRSPEHRDYDRKQSGQLSPVRIKMRIVLLLLSLAISATAAPPEKTKEKVTSKTTSVTTRPTTKTTELPKVGNETHNNTTVDVDQDADEEIDDYCYDSTWSFKCRQTSPTEFDLECRIANADGEPCFPNLVRMIEVSAPLSTITYPIYSVETREAAESIDVTPTIVTAENIESISLHAPFEHIPADAFASLPHLKRIVIESLDGVKAIAIDKNAFRNTTAKQLQLAGHNIRHIMAQKVDWHYFDTITFSDVEIECHQSPKGKPISNATCDRLFENMKSVEKLNLESIYVDGDQMDSRMLHPMWESLTTLTLDVVFRSNAGRRLVLKQGSNSTLVRRHGYFPVEIFAFMTRLEEMELYLYEPIIGLSVQNDTAIPLPVSKTLTRLTLSCRYCKSIDLTQLGKMLPNLQHLTIAAPLAPKVITDTCLKAFTKLVELVIYNGDFTGIKPGAFRSTDSLKHLTIKYADVENLTHEHWDGLEDTLQSLTIVGTEIRSINVSKFEHLTSLDVSQNHLTTIDRSLLPAKGQFTTLDLSYNPITHVENGFLSGIEMKNGDIRMQGWDIELMDLNMVEGMEKLRVVDITNNLKLKNLTVTDYTKLPSDLHRIIVGRSPFLLLSDYNGTISKMLQERNMTMVIQGQVACGCDMAWMIEMEKEYPRLIEFDTSRAMCSREGTEPENLSDDFWKKPTVVNFLKTMSDEKVDMCKKGRAKATKAVFKGN